MTTAFRTVPIDSEPSPLDPSERKPRREITDEQREKINRQARERRARKSGSRPRARKQAPRGPKSLAPELTAFLSMANMLLIMTPLGTRPVAAIYDPEVAPEKIGDELDAGEIAALASALDAQCRRSPRFKKYVEKVLGAGSGGALVTVLGMIVVRRAARHGIIPNGEAVDYALGVTLAGGGDLLNFEPPASPDTTPDTTTGEVAPDRSFDFETNSEGDTDA